MALIEQAALKAHSVELFGQRYVDVRDIDDAPTIDTAPVVHGRWKTKRGNYITGGGDPLWECSQCGHIYGASLLPPKYHFCPNCGCKMKGE